MPSTRLVRFVFLFFKNMGKGHELPQPPPDGTPPKDLPSSVVERWRNAPSRVDSYGPGTVLNADGTSYRYPAGRKLLTWPIPGEDPIEVMDTCEAPWAVAIVNQAFATDKIARLDRSYKLRVLERGAGLNIVGSKIIDHLMQRGSGEYHVVELNQEVLHNPEWGTYAWRQRALDRIAETSRLQGIRYNIDIQIHEGEARQVTRELAEQGSKFNIIIGDTIPLDSSESGINDIVDIDVTKKSLYREGVLGFFAYFPGIENEEEGSHLAAKQLAILRPNFGHIDVSEVRIRTPRSYGYLGGERPFPVSVLPVVTCTDKK